MTKVSENKSGSGYHELGARDVACNIILQAVEEGVQSKRDSIRLFELNGTGVYITSEKEEWKSGVQQAMDFFASVEDYAKCITARQLLTRL